MTVKSCNIYMPQCEFGVFPFSQIKGSILVEVVMGEATPLVNSLTNLRAIILLSKQYYPI